MVSTGLPVLIAPVAGDAVLARARPDFGALDRLLPRGTDNVYVVACARDAGRASSRHGAPDAVMPTSGCW